MGPSCSPTGSREGERGMEREERIGHKIYPSKHAPSDSLPLTEPHLLDARSARNASVDQPIDEISGLVIKSPLTTISWAPALQHISSLRGHFIPILIHIYIYIYTYIIST
jgi:hypothetical protein